MEALDTTLYEEGTQVPLNPHTTSSQVSYKDTTVKKALEETVNFTPQDLTPEQQTQARENINALEDEVGGIDTEHIADDAVTTPKIADRAVTSDKIGDGAITNDKISAGAVSADKLNTDLQSKVNDNVKTVEQTLTAEQKAQARKNIDVDYLTFDVAKIIEAGFDIEETPTNVPLTVHTQDGSSGYYTHTYSVFVADNSRRTCEIINVNPGEKYLVSTHLSSRLIAAALFYRSDGSYHQQYWNLGTGTSQDLVDEPLIIPDGIYKVRFQSSNLTAPVVKKVSEDLQLKSYTKAEADARFAPISTTPPIKKYGVKWAINDDDDLGQRCFDAIGMNAQIGIGPTNGQSDFDSVFPWSEMKRCNIKTNANGAKIVTFEGETGFALDGSNGNVFVRIPKFYSERYTENGEEYIVISSVGNTVHPAFIEDGKELNEIFVAAFEGRIIDGKLSSRSGVIPSNNETGQTFLDAAKANGDQYTLYDMRAVDALWRLMAVEYGCRNSNRILGWGYSDYQQPIDKPAYRVSVAASNTNIVTLGLPIDDIERKRSLARFAPGSTITICDGSQFVIVAQRVVTAVSQPTVNDNLVITFDGVGIDVTTNMWIGSAPCVTNRCETIDSTYRLAWHTGRTSYNPGTYINPETFNPCRYRWIENVVGSCWHILPDISFNGGQMYVCQNMRDYVMHKITAPYIPIGDILPINADNGNKSDVANANYWVTKLMNDVFARGVNFGTAYNKALTSTKAFGAYYYLYNTRVAIVNGGGFDHLWRSNILTNRAWLNTSDKWYLYGGRLMFKNIN